MIVVRFIAWTFLWLIAFVCVVWAIGALYFDFPLATLRGPVAILFSVLVFAAIIFIRKNIFKFVGVMSAFAAVLIWWFTLQPNKDGNWQPDVAETGWAEMNGDVVTVHNVRNCD